MTPAGSSSSKDDADRMRTQSPGDQEPPVTQPPTPAAADSQAAGDDAEAGEMVGTNSPGTGAHTDNGQPTMLGEGLTEE